jgi:hypothetical protein
MSLDERRHWINVLVGVVLPILWGAGYTLLLIVARRGSVSHSVRELTGTYGYTMVPVALAGVGVGLLVHWFGVR